MATKDQTMELLRSDKPLRPTLSPYTYVRTTVMASKLFDAAQYAKILKLQLPEIIQFMEESSYKREIDELARAERGVPLVEHAVQRNFRRAIEKLRRISDDSLHLLIDVYLWRNDIENVKMLVRAKESKQPIERLQNLFIPGSIPKTALLSYYEAHDIPEMLERIKVPFAENAANAYRDGGLSILEGDMMQRYYQFTYRIALRIKDEQDLIRQFLLLEVDLINVLTILKRKRKGQKLEEIVPHIVNAYGDTSPSGRTTQQRFRRKLYLHLLEAKDIEACLAVLEDSRYKDVVREGAAAYRKTGSLLEMERDFQMHLLKRASTLSHQHPLSTDIVISFLFAKVIETHNLMIIIKGKELELAEPLLAAELIIR